MAMRSSGIGLLAVCLSLVASTVSAQDPGRGRPSTEEAAKQIQELRSQLEAVNRQRQATQAARSAQPGERLAGFNVVLVQGDMKGESATESIPAAVEKALADMKVFLPYRSYQLLDTQWTMSSGAGRVLSRLERRGTEYELEMHVAPGPSDLTITRFVLTELGVQVAKAGSSASMLETLRAEKAPPVTSERRTIIDSSFRMSLGETVVVGTSRIVGDRALIVLLTAVAR